jgi:hypothetical protein
MWQGRVCVSDILSIEIIERLAVWTFHIDFYPGVFFFYELEWHKGFQIKIISEALKFIRVQPRLLDNHDVKKRFFSSPWQKACTISSVVAVDP